LEDDYKKGLMGDQSTVKRFFGCGIVIEHPFCCSFYDIAGLIRGGVPIETWIPVVMRDIYNFMDAPIGPGHSPCGRVKRTVGHWKK
jgi:hypothetical protein